MFGEIDLARRVVAGAPDGAARRLGTRATTLAEQPGDPLGERSPAACCARVNPDQDGAAIKLGPNVAAGRGAGQQPREYFDGEIESPTLRRAERSHGVDLRRVSGHRSGGVQERTRTQGPACEGRLTDLAPDHLSRREVEYLNLRSWYGEGEADRIGPGDRIDAA